MVYRFTAAGQQFELTESQFHALLQGLGVWLFRKADYIHGMAEVGRDSQQDHRDNTNSVVRHISDWLADQDELSLSIWDTALNNSASIRFQLQNADFNALPIEAGKSIIPAMARQLETSATALDDAQRQWHQYIEGTISGAQVAVNRLEVVRNVSFGVAGGLAGAVAAPAAFALLGAAGASTTVATAGALVVAGTAGGTLRGTLDVVAPGAMSGTAASRFEHGFGSGFEAGVLGGAGAFAAPAVSGVVAKGVTSVGGEAFAASTAGRYTIGALTGTALGVPTGATGAALDNASALARGEISGGEYATRIATGGAIGGALGFATSFVPIRGLTREGGVPWRGDVAPVPRWMFAGPASPLQSRWDPPGGTWINAPRGSGLWNPPPGFNQLPLEQLPKLPPELAWTRVEYQGQAQWEPMSVYGPSRQPLELTWYDDPSVTSANYLLRAGGRTIYGTQTFTGASYTGLPANTGAGGAPLPGAPSSTRGDFPVTSAEYTDPATGGVLTRGHIIDYRSTTPRTAEIPDSNMDPANFTPEEPFWGGGRLPGGGRSFGGRMQLTNRIVRANPGGGPKLAQYNVYTSGRVTQSGTPIPDSYILVERDPAGIPTRAWDVPNSPGSPPLNSAAAVDAAYGIGINQIPQPVLDHLRLEASVAVALGAAIGTSE
jgi:hypothetical protein